MPQTARRGRQLPYVSERARFTVPGVGSFATETVGSTRSTSGVYVYCHPEGAEEAAPGACAYEMVISEDMEIDWAYRGSAPLRRGAIAELDVYAEAGLTFVRNLEHTDSNAWMFLLLGKIGDELDALALKRQLLEGRIDYLSLATQGRPWRNETRTKEELQARLAELKRELQDLEGRVSEREGRLRATRTAIHDWAYRPKGSVVTLAREKLGCPDRRATEVEPAAPAP